MWVGPQFCSCSVRRADGDRTFRQSSDVLQYFDKVHHRLLFHAGCHRLFRNKSIIYSRSTVRRTFAPNTGGQLVVPSREKLRHLCCRRVDPSSVGC